MCSFWSASLLVSHSRCQQHWPRFRKTTNIWICPISTSDIPCIDIQCNPMYLPPELELLRLTQFYLLLSPVMRLVDVNVIHGLKHRFAVYNIKWWTSGRHELTWLLFYAAFSTIALVAIHKANINSMVRWGRLHYDRDLERAWTWQRLSTDDG